MAADWNAEDWLDETDWSFEEERPLADEIDWMVRHAKMLEEQMTTRSHHKKPPVQKVPEMRPEPPPSREPVQRDSDYQAQVLEKLDRIIEQLGDLLDHMRGQ